VSIGLAVPGLSFLSIDAKPHKRVEREIFLASSVEVCLHWVVELIGVQDFTRQRRLRLIVRATATPIPPKRVRQRVSEED
jgi:hypothetical protein